MPVAPEAVFRAICDVERYPDFMPYVKESKVLARDGPDGLSTYTRLTPPLVSDRDYVLKIKLTRGTRANGGVFKSEWGSAPEMLPEKPGVVRVKVNTGAWLLEPLDAGKRTRASYHLHTHPGGDIPDWLANKSNTSAIPDLFQAVARRAQVPPAR
jgi:ribosome-associated toxin RatA of RatAB toxin-antitoxin module